MATLNILNKISMLAATSVIAVTATMGKASAVTFYLGNGLDVPEIESSFSYTQEGISLLATGTQRSGADRNLYRSTLGLGVTNQNNLLNLGESQIDGGISLGETLNLTFANKPVKLLSATFSRVGSNDDFKLLVDGNQFIAADIPGGNSLDFDISKFSFSPSPTGNVFGFTVSDNNDDYYVKYIEVEAIPVPEPGSVVGLLAFGAMGAGSMIKRKQQR